MQYHESVSIAAWRRTMKSKCVSYIHRPPHSTALVVNEPVQTMKQGQPNDSTCSRTFRPTVFSSNSSVTRLLAQSHLVNKASICFCQHQGIHNALVALRCCKQDSTCSGLHCKKAAWRLSTEMKVYTAETRNTLIRHKALDCSLNC